MSKVDWATLKEGDEIPPIDMLPTLESVLRYCALNWAFQGFFYDDAAAQAMGMPEALIPGPFKVGWLYRAVDEWLDGAGFIRQVRAANRRPDHKNNPVTIAGHVVRVYEEGGAKRADLEMAVINKEGQPSVRGFAVVEFR